MYRCSVSRTAGLHLSPAICVIGASCLWRLVVEVIRALAEQAFWATCRLVSYYSSVETFPSTLGFHRQEQSSCRQWTNPRQVVMRHA